jgi:predicted Zn finger-like uncharacterized protein
MVVTCPNCRSRYAVDPLKIGPAGRTVECARCHHQWHQIVEGPPPAAPELVIRPTTSGSSLPAIIPPKPAFARRHAVAVAVVVVAVVVLAVAAFALRGTIARMISQEARASMPVQVTARMPPTPQIEIDLSTSSIDVVDGRIVVRGQLVNNGRAPGSTTLLRLTFKRNDDVLGERSFPMVEGPLPPGGRTAFSQTVDDPPAGTTDIVPAVE